ncbi:MAG: HDOD domain-containing protein [Holophaga sp.]|jgi:putative nucleotidyltransferase with HDIG domain
MPITPQELISNLGDLPPLPQVATQVLRLAVDPDSTTDDLQRVVGTDQALAAQILKIANSAMFGMVREVRTLTQAIMTLGFSTIKSIVIASSARNLYHRGGTGLQERLLWEHALTAALAARAYAKGLRSSRMEEAFLGGLMHDIGKSVMSLKFPERYGAMVRSIYNEDGDAVDTELDLFGFDHAMVGEALLGSWNLAHSLSDAVRWHHAPAHAPEGHRDLAAFVALGNQLALDRGVGLGRPESLREPTAQAMEILGFTEESLGVQRLAVVAALEADKNLIRDF